MVLMPFFLILLDWIIYQRWSGNIVWY